MDDIDKVLAASRAEQERKEQEQLERILLESARASGLDGVPAGGAARSPAASSYSRHSSSASSSASSGSRHQPVSSSSRPPAPMSSFGSSFGGGSVLQGSGNGAGASSSSGGGGGYAAFGESYDATNDDADDAGGWGSAEGAFLGLCVYEHLKSSWSSAFHARGCDFSR